MAFLQWLEGSGLSTWVREASTVWAFPTILTLHTFGLGLVAGASAVVDLRLLGIGRQFAVTALRPLFRVMWVGFWLNAVTGCLLFAADAIRLGTSVFFLTKLVFVAIGVTTILLIKRRVFDAPQDGARVVPVKVVAIVSLAAWSAAIATGRLLAYI